MPRGFTRHSKRWMLSILALAVLLVVQYLFPPQQPTPSAPLPEGTHRVERVVDGDTLMMEGGIRLRLQGIDAPETVKPDSPVELAIVVAGARGDLGQHAAAVLQLKDLTTRGTGREPWAVRVRYAYAAALEADGQEDEAAVWFRRAAEVDAAGETDAAEILGLEDEPVLVDLVGDEDDDEGPGDKSPEAEPSPTLDAATESVQADRTAREQDAAVQTDRDDTR